MLKPEHQVTVPSGWQYSVCDFGTCYSGIPVGPNTMDTVAVNGQGFLGLNIDPSGVAGSGIVKLYVYQNGFPNSGDTLTWTINASMVGIEEITNKNIAIEEPASAVIVAEVVTEPQDNGSTEVVEKW